MSTQQRNDAFATITQRAVSSYRRLMPDAQPATSAGAQAEQTQRDLHAFFASLYDNMAAQPDRFGLPISPDACIAEADVNKPSRKQEVKRLLDKPKRMIDAGLSFLMQAGIHGRLDGSALVVDDVAVLVAQSAVKRQFLAGLEATSLTIERAGDTATITHSRFPAMMPALKAMAERCSAFADTAVGATMFAVCHLPILDRHTLEPLNLYGMFDEEDRARVGELHSYFSERGYTTDVELHAPGHWVVKYQGDRAVKATPLYQVGYDDRHEWPVMMEIKCGSVARLAPLLPAQSPLLRDDFAQRVSLCRGDACGWCKNQKTLGPTVMEINGEAKTVCWYVYPDVRTLDANTVELIRQYEQMHAGLARPSALPSALEK